MASRASETRPAARPATRTAAVDRVKETAMRELARQVRRLDEYELRRLLILVRGRLVHVDGHPDADPDLPPGLSYRQERVRCGKATCTTCPHGPYWYAHWREGSKARKRYIGRHLPGEPLETVTPDLPGKDTRGGH